MTKLANWDTALTLFVEEYKLPIILPELAAYLAVSIELTAPVLLVLGLLTRPTAMVLLGMTAVIEGFVYPLAWPTHMQWAAMLLVLLCRGPGSSRSITCCSVGSARNPLASRKVAPLRRDSRCPALRPRISFGGGNCRGQRRSK